MPKQSGCFVNALGLWTWSCLCLPAFIKQLADKGYIARAGQMIDATFVEVPRQRNTREENAQLKAGEVPEAWDKPEAQAKRRQKDTEARWTKKNEEKHYGYKNHINADQQYKLIQSYAVTPASVHDSQVFDELLDQSEAPMVTSEQCMPTAPTVHKIRNSGLLTPRSTARSVKKAREASH